MTNAGYYYYVILICFNLLLLLPGISVTAPIRRSTPWAFIRKKFRFVPTIEMPTLFSFPSENQLNTQGAVTENPGNLHEIYHIHTQTQVLVRNNYRGNNSVRDIMTSYFL